MRRGAWIGLGVAAAALLLLGAGSTRTPELVASWTTEQEVCSTSADVGQGANRRTEENRPVSLRTVAAGIDTWGGTMTGTLSAWRGGGEGTCGVRIYDENSETALCSVTGIVAASYDKMHTCTLAGVGRKASVWALQVKPSGEVSVM